MNHHRRSAQVWRVFSRDFTVLPAHPHVHLQSEWAIPAWSGSSKKNRSHFADYAAVESVIPMRKSKQTLDADHFPTLSQTDACGSLVILPAAHCKRTTTVLSLRWSGGCLQIGTWKRPLGRPSRTWLRAVEADLGLQNIGLASAWRKEAIRDDWRRIVDTATL